MDTLTAPRKFIDYKPLPEQIKFHLGTEDFVGPKCSGKSVAALMDATRYVDNPRYTGLVIGERYVENLAHHLYHLNFPGVSYNTACKRYTFPSGATLELVGPTAHSIPCVQGMSYNYIVFDDADSEEASLELKAYITSRLRSHKDLPEVYRETRRP